MTERMLIKSSVGCDYFAFFFKSLPTSKLPSFTQSTDFCHRLENKILKGTCIGCAISGTGLSHMPFLSLYEVFLSVEGRIFGLYTSNSLELRSCLKLLDIVGVITLAAYLN